MSNIKAQTPPYELTSEGGELQIGENDATHPCISPDQYASIEKRCAENLAMLSKSGIKVENFAPIALNWPLKAAAGFTDCSFYYISAFVDQNTTSGVFSDYNCGTRTYDGHKGTDIAIVPFGFYKMDNNLVEVAAAAAGMIVDKADGNFDRNCAANNLTANYVVIQHADGSRALYWHMKKNYVTTKAIGQSVAQGEYLGVVGSSGSSSGPHLHFEVWTGSTNATRNDPFSGPCNTLNASSWWAAQKPYAETAIIKASVNSTDFVSPGCPETETPNESTCFAMPFQGPGLPANAAKFYIFFRNEVSGLTANMSILNPDGSTFNSWTYTSTATNNFSYRGFTKNLPATPGTYTFQSMYNGLTCSRTFDIITGLVTPNGPTSFCQGNSVLLSAGVAQSYIWSNGDTTRNITVSSSGSYTVTVTGQGGCTAVSAATAVTVNPAPTATITPSGATTFCQGGSVSLSVNAATSYLWSTGATTQNISVSTSGSYKVTVTGAGGCTAVSAATTVNVNPAPTATITPGGATTFCQGSTVSLSVNAATSYLWSTGATTQNISVSTSGSYKVTVTGAGGCTAVSAATAVTVNPAPTATITPGGATTFCQGGSVSLSVNAATSYLWSTGATTQNISVSTSGSYTVTVTGAGGCTAVSAATTVTVNPLPTASITPSSATTFCQGGTVSLSVSAATSYLWSTGATTQNISVSTSGSYKVTVTGMGACTAVSPAVTVVVFPSPLPPVITANGSILKSSYTTGNQWFLNGNVIPGATAQTLVATQNGNYTVQFSDGNGCIVSSLVFNFMSSGIEIIPNQSVFSLSPNPNQGEFSLVMHSGNDWSRHGLVQIFNVLGARIYQGNLEHQITDIDISTQPDGIFFVQIRSDFGQQTIRVLKN